MLCSDTTGNMPAIRIPGVKVRDIDDFAIVDYLQACRAVRENPSGQANGNILIELLQGFVSKIIPSYVIHRKRGRERKLLIN